MAFIYEVLDYLIIVCERRHDGWLWGDQTTVGQRWADRRGQIRAGLLSGVSVTMRLHVLQGTWCISTQKTIVLLLIFLLVVWSHIIATEKVIHFVICLKSTKNHYILSTKRIYNDFTYNVPVTLLMENLFNKNGNLIHSWFVCNYFCSTVKLRMASCTLPHSQQFWDPWVLGLSWVTALLPYLNSAKSKTQDCSSAQRKLPGSGYVNVLDPVCWFVCFFLQVNA